MGGIPLNILALECSSRVLTVALLKAAEYSEIHLDVGFNHTTSLMPAIDSLMKLSQLSPREIDLVACSAGPGTFTGLRIGLATAKGIAEGASCALKAVATLPLLAVGREHWPGIVMPIMDARKNRVYTAAFAEGQQIKEAVDVPLDVFLASLPQDEKILVSGPGANLAQGAKNIFIDPAYNSSRGRAMIEMALELYNKDGSDSPDMGPIYLRLSDAQEK